MCIAQDRRFKKPLGKACLAGRSKSDRIRKESTFMNRAFHVEAVKVGSHSMVHNTSSKGFRFPHESFEAATAVVNLLKEASQPKKDVASIEQTTTIDTMPSEESAPSDMNPMNSDEKSALKAREDTPTTAHQQVVALKPRISIFNEQSNKITSKSREDLLRLRMVKSFDEDRKNDKYSLIWTSDSVKSIGSEGRIKVAFDFGRGAPSAKNSLARPEPLTLEDDELSHLQDGSSTSDPSMFETPETSFRNYEDIPTPPTPRHSMPLCHFDRWTPPAHLLLPTFCIE